MPQQTQSGWCKPKIVTSAAIAQQTLDSALCEYAAYRGIKCPVLFCVTDNNISISLKGHGWAANKFVRNRSMEVFEADGSVLADLWHQAANATSRVRATMKPALLYVKNVPRRFGHAATDRQSAYLSATQIAAAEEANPLAMACAAAVDEGLVSWQQLAGMYSEIESMTAKAFDTAVKGAEAWLDAISTQT